jgi:hypothetical protein
MHAKASSAQAWIVLGVLSLALTAVVWPIFSLDAGAEKTVPQTRGALRWDRESLRLVLCYGVFGFGYIIPATFLPAMARQAIHDPLVFGWSWPIFGVAAMASTLVAAALPPSLSTADRGSASVLMAIGVALPAFCSGIAGSCLQRYWWAGPSGTTMVAIREKPARSAGLWPSPHRGRRLPCDRADRRPIGASYLDTTKFLCSALDRKALRAVSARRFGRRAPRG